MATNASVARTGRALDSALSSPVVAFGLIVAFAVATRIVAWWDPVMHGDDQLYLLLGSRMWHGEWPYLDLWDRKPVGLFALYAVIARIGGSSMVVVKLIATAFIVATAWLLRRIALRFASRRSALFAALGYVLIVPLFGGQSGQSPVFYNLFMAGAALLMFGAADATLVATIRRRALAAMLLCGLSLTIKQVSVFEGVYFGLAFLWLLWRRDPHLARLVVTAVAMVILALLPTAITLAPYFLRGTEAVDAFLYANVASVFGRSSWGWISRLYGVALLLMFGLLFACYGLAGLVRLSYDTDQTLARRLLIGWIVAALVSYLAIPNFFDHYALPLMMPLAVSTAPFYDRPRGALFFAAFTFFCMIQRPIWNWRSHEISRQTYDNIAREVDRARLGGCIYVAKGPSLLYLTTGACHVTRFVFPPHLLWIIEQGAIGTDNLAELRRTLATRPAVIVSREGNLNQTTPAADALLGDTLARDYRETYRTPGTPNAWRVVVYQRRDLTAPRGSFKK